jgi:hypothetical protein
VVISSEDFEASLLHPDVWMPFANVAAGRGVALHFIVYLRDVPGYIESLYLEQASSQHGHEYALYAREALQHGRLMINEMEFCFHFDRVQSGLRAVPNSRVTFRSYNDLRSGSIVQDFLSVIDPTGGLGGAIGPERRQNSRRDPSVSFEVYLRSRDIRINREGERPSQLVADAFKGRSPKLTAPRRMRAALAARLSTTAFAGREDYARKFLEASRPDYLPVADEGEQLVNIARVFSVESQVLFRRILRLEAIGRASPEWRARLLDDWWSWISDIS